MTEEVTVLVGEDVGVRDEIEGVTAEFFLKLYVVEAKAVFPGDFVRVREMIDPLVLV